MQAEREGNRDGDDDDDEVPVDQEVEHSMTRQRGEDVSDDMGYRVACVGQSMSSKRL